MAPRNPKVTKAYEAMKVFGYTAKDVKPVLNNLLKLYNKNWELIEDENYSALVESIIDSKKSKVRHLVDEPEEDEPPLKRSRLSSQGNHSSLYDPSPSADTCTSELQIPSKQKMAEFTTESYETEDVELKPLSLLNHHQRQGKKRSSSEASPPVSEWANDIVVHSDDDMQGPCALSNPAVIPKRRLTFNSSPEEPNVMGSTDASNQGALVEYDVSDSVPLNVPFSDNLPGFDVPLAVVPSEGNEEGATNSSRLDIASSSKGEVKISFVYMPNSSSDFCPPSLDAVLKRMEEKYIKSYGFSQPGFALLRLMENLCKCYLTAGTKARAANEPSVESQKLHPVGFKLSNLVKVVPQIPKFPASVSAYYIEDISNGQEEHKISLINEFSHEILPVFKYIPKNVIFQNAYVKFLLARISDDNCCSSCSGDCLSQDIPCACAGETGGEFAYTSGGLLKEKFLENCISMNREPQKHGLVYCQDCPLERSKNNSISGLCKGHLVRKFVKECWHKCGCSKRCGNRVVQRGIAVPLQVFMTADGKGWGLRALEALPRGAFVCEYVGEIVTNTELYERNTQTADERHTYPVLLDADWGSEGVLKDEEALCLDATSYGNVARFINHRCYEANLIEIPVEVETPDHHYYHVAFFTTRKVNALEELTWDYGIDFTDHSHPVKAFKCCCGSKVCRDISLR